MPRETPMMQQYREIKEQYHDCLLFFRLGDFYEMFFDDALLASRLLEITLTSRDGGDDERVPMCGVPYHAAEDYLAKLVGHGLKVAICDQVEDPKEAKGLVRRAVVRVVTPGTVMESSALEQNANNYLAAVASDDYGYGLALADISTGEFGLTELRGTEAEDKLRDELHRLKPAELLFAPAGSEADLIQRMVGDTGIMLTPLGEGLPSPDEVRQLLQALYGESGINELGCEGMPLGLQAAAAIIAYLNQTQKTSLGHLQLVQPYLPDQYLQLDATTRRNLELTRSLRDGGRRGTLLSVLDRTCTAMGGRQIKSWIERPLVDPVTINRRLDRVEALVRSAARRTQLREVLDQVYDLERLVARVSYGTANARDLVGLKRSLSVLPRLASLLNEDPALASLGQGIDTGEGLCALLAAALVDDPPVSLGEGGIIRDGYSAQVDEYRRARREGRDWIAQLEQAERERTGIKSLKVGFNRVFGYYLEVTRANLSAVPADYQRKQTLANAERFITPELKEKEELILGAEDKLAALEYRLFCELRDRVAADSRTVQETARVIAEVDCLCSLAEVAVRHRYVRPVVDRSDAIEIAGGRHPVVEESIGAESFVANDTCLNRSDHRFLLLTGPNMAGKSTYMRQVALIVLLAQLGSFVPAKSARIGVVDRIFTRVGASDDLAGGQSTFMVEMTETANIIRNATSRSLLILDEVGRGTSTFDGLSIAWAVIEYIHTRPGLGCRTLFATHYHELTELEAVHPGIVNYSMAIQEKGHDLIFLRRLERGGSDHSYGLQVARLAGLPGELLERAGEILATLESNEEVKKAQRQVAASSYRQRHRTQLSLFEAAPHPVLEELRGLKVMEMTPLQALNTLYQLQEKARKDE